MRCIQITTPDSATSLTQKHICSSNNRRSRVNIHVTKHTCPSSTKKFHQLDSPRTYHPTRLSLVMAHADHTRDPWYVFTSPPSFLCSPLFQPLGCPQRLWWCFLYGCRRWWHLVWHQGRQEFASSMSVPSPWRVVSSQLLQGERLVGAVSSIKARAPVTGGNFGVWGGMFSTFDCAIKGWRQKEDAWNAILSGFLTGGCLAARSELFPVLAPSALYLLLSRWSQISTRLSHCLWYPTRRLRGCRCPYFSGFQRGQPTTDGTT